LRAPPGGLIWALADSGADAELIGLAKACLAPQPEARPADAAEVAGRVKRYRDEVAARQSQAERVLWLRAVGEAFPPAAEDARARLRQQAWALLCTEVAAQAQQLSTTRTNRHSSLGFNQLLPTTLEIARFVEKQGWEKWT
jgi:hypothetical protein